MKIKNMVFIHGMFMNKDCWNDWISYFSNEGYTCIAPSWPGHDGEPGKLRNLHPSAQLETLKLDDIVSEFELLIRKLESPPVLIGHSMGGLIVQLLLNNNHGACGIAIDSAPPAGVFTTKWSFLKANFPVINPLKGNKPDLISYKRFQYAFVNDLPESVQRDAYNTYVVPESRNVPRSSTGKAGKINFRKEHNPLLIIAGGNDNIIPPSLTRSNYAKYKSVSSITNFVEFPGRNHFIIRQENWQEVAACCNQWILKI